MQKIQLLILTIVLCCATSLQAQRIFELMETDGVNLKEVQDEAAIYFAKVGTGKGTGYKLFKRWEYHAKSNLQEDGTVRGKKDRVGTIRKSKKAASLGAKTISPSDWTELGPLIHATNDFNGSGMGRVTAIYVEPINQQLIYIGSPGGGLWKSNNGGNSWSPLGDQFDDMSIWSIEADPTNTNTIYVGNSIGELLKSTNGGLSFTKLFTGNGRVRDILINPNDTDDIYIALPSDGLFHTTNGGSTWTEVITKDYIEDVMFKPGSTSTIYACGHNFYRSTNSGASFTSVTDGISSYARMKLAVSPDNSNYVYIVQKATSGFGYLYRSTNSGASFTAQSVRSDVDYIGIQAHKDMAITVSDTNANEVHIGGLRMYKSLDGGVSFTQETTESFGESLASDALSYLHADIEILNYINGTMYIGSDGGIYKSTDDGASFTDLSTGIGIRQFYRISCSPSNKNLVVGGSQDNGTAMKSDPSHQWMKFHGGDGTSSMIDPTNENIIYCSAQNGILAKTINGGQSLDWSFVKPPEYGTGEWVTPLAMDPDNSSRIYIGYSNLYRHDNAGISGGWINASPNFDFYGNLRLLDICASNSDVIYAATITKMYKSTNITTSSPTWTELTLPSSLSIWSFINYISVDPYDENRVAVVTTSGNVLLSEDGGASWEEINNGLPDTSVQTIVFDRSPDKGIYVAIHGVVYYKSNSVPNWTAFSDNLPNVEIEELELYYDKEVQEDSRIRVATYGRGAWESPLYDDRDSNGILSCATSGISAYSTIQAEDFCEESGVQKGNNGTTVGYIQNGDYIRFDEIQFGSGALGFEASVSSGSAGGTIEIRLDSPTGTLAGTCSVNTTGGWTTWADISCDINGASGAHDLYLVCTGGDGYLFDIDSFKFIEGSNCSSAGISAYSTIQAEDFCDQLEIQTSNNGTAVGYINNGDYIKFDSVAFGDTGAGSFEAVVSSNSASGGTIEIRLDSPTSASIGTCSVDYTGGWTVWDHVSCSINEVTGNHDVYIVFTGGSGYLFDIDSFKFIETSTIFPDPSKKYYIDAPHHNLRIAADGITDDRPYTVSTNTIGETVEWKFVAKGNGYWHIDLALEGAIKPRLRSDNTENADMQVTSYAGGWTYYDLEEGVFPETHFLTLPSGPTNYKRLQINSTGDVKMVDTGHAGTWESFLFTEVGSLTPERKETLDIASELEKISMFPNPVSTTLHIQLPTEGEKTLVSISNIAGQIVSKTTFDTHKGLNLLKVDIAEFAAGLYNVTILKGETKLIKNIVVQK